MSGDEFSRWKAERQAKSGAAIGYPYRVIDAEPIDEVPPKPWPGLKLGLLAGFLLGVWFTFLAQLFARWVS